jgi:hypothetical protein
VNVYPSQYQPGELTAHVVALLERRRAAFEDWSDANEASLMEEARRALAEAGAQFREVADDAEHWRRVTEQVLTVAMPRYLKLAREQHRQEKSAYGAWRGGDLLSRAAFAIGGLVVGVVVFRTALPDWLEPLPLAFFIGGPMIPDVQGWLGRRRHAKSLATLVDDMKQEAADRSAYQPLGIDEHVAGTPPESLGTSAPREKV